MFVASAVAMGCGASAQQDQNDRSDRRDHGKSSNQQNGKHADVAAAAGRKPPPDPYAAEPEEVETAEDGDDHPAVTVAVLAELRTRSRDMHTGGTVPKWIEGITEPNENDAPDVYDPARRHVLAMESLHNRLNAEA